MSLRDTANSLVNIVRVPCWSRNDRQSRNSEHNRETSSRLSLRCRLFLLATCSGAAWGSPSC